ncbi:MAG: hypothetical protein H0U10_01140 [Chloroflexia bacterium]|nr:hypothetical protein [Chloroflexia bacterium]
MSSGVTAARASPTAATTAAKVRGAARRISALLLAKACSIGLKSGE